MPLPWSSSSSSPNTSQRDGEWGIQPVHKSSFLLLLSPYAVSCFKVESLPWKTVLRELLYHGSFPQAVVLHKLLQHRSFPQGPVIQKQTAPAWVTHGVTDPARKPSPAWTPLHGVDSPVRSLLQLRLCMDCRLDICSTVDFHGMQENNLCHPGLHHRLQGNLCSGIWTTSSPHNIKT